MRQPDRMRPLLLDRDCITAAWLTEVLRRAGVVTAGSVISVTCAPTGTGQVADTLRCQLEFDVHERGAPRTVIAKVSAADATSRATAARFRLYEREVRFYQHLAPKVAIRTPLCFFADLDDAGSFVLLMEDLAPAASIDQLTGFTADHAATALVQLAGLHGPCWNDTALHRLDWLATDRARTEAFVDGAAPLFDGFLERYRTGLEPEWLDVVRQLQPLHRRFLLDRSGPFTVQHGDYRPDNMIFGGSGGIVPLAVVDWQTVAVGPGLVDVAYLLGTSLDTGTRRAQEEQLVRAYHAALGARGVEGYPWERCWSDYRRLACHGVFFLSLAAMQVQQTERGDTMFLTMLRRAAAQVTDLESASLV